MKPDQKILIGVGILAVVGVALISGCIGGDETVDGGETEPTQPNEKTEEPEVQHPQEPTSWVECDSCKSCTDAISNAKSNEGVKLMNDIKNNNQYGACMEWLENNIIFDCQGHTIEGFGPLDDKGIFLYEVSGNIIRNCVINHFEYGIYLSDATNNNILNNKVNSGGIGIYLISSSNNQIVNNYLNNNGYDGISLRNSSNNFMNDNKISRDKVTYLEPRIIFTEPAPENASIVNTNYVNINISSDTYLSSIILEWNGTNRSMSRGKDNWYTHIEYLKTGIYSYRAYASVCGETMGITDERFVIINDTSPLKVTYIHECKNLEEPYILFSANRESNYTLTYGINNKLNNSIVNSSMERYHVVSLPSVPNGTIYYYRITYCDISGNCNSTDIKNITIRGDVDSRIKAKIGKRLGQVIGGKAGINIRYSSSNNTLINNTIYGICTGMYLSECSFNNLVYNNITNNYNTGIFFRSGTTNNILTSNLICENGLDIENYGLDNSGTNNTCDTTSVWNDNRKEGCTYNCS